MYLNPSFSPSIFSIHLSLFLALFQISPTKKRNNFLFFLISDFKPQNTNGSSVAFTYEEALDALSSLITRGTRIGGVNMGIDLST
ncbi:hypothetical protein Lalb_Chr12g0210031 [Lupinus albus]|uniref:Uncharacterized protein n=1 Tax=Lupinus albus TaxID=3870 RepID=A0A6A4PPD4_LUPAL|nr:hypothetical protein Lalb_Chr12g0210031 [Lupinus albus]